MDHERAVGERRLARERGPEVGPVEVGGDLRPGERGERRMQVDHVDGVRELLPAREAPPRDDERGHADAAFEQLPLPAGERRVVRAERGSAAVVAREHEDGLAIDALALERLDDASDRGVQHLDHRREDTAFGPVDVALPVHPLARRLQRHVGRMERDEQEEGPGGIPRFDDAHRLVGQQLRRVTPLLLRPTVAMPVEPAERLVPEVVDLTEIAAVVMVEPVLRRNVLAGVMPEVPLADEMRAVADPGQRLGDRRLGAGQPVVRPGPDDVDLETVPVRVAAGEQRRARRRAARRRVEAREPHALGREAIERRRPDLASVPADVVPAEVVGHDHDEIRCALVGAPDRARQHDERETGECPDPLRYPPRAVRSHPRAVYPPGRPWIALVLLAVGALGCAPADPTPGLGSETNVIFVVIDTLRADRLGVYGHDVPTSPNLDAFARESVVFEQAQSPSAWTLPAMVSAMTSTWPNDHDVVARGQRVPPGLSPLAERLQRAGFRTAGFVANPLAATASGLDRGYDELERTKRTVPAPQVGAWLDRTASEPFFLYLHSTEPHLPYSAPAAAFEQIGAVPPRDRAALVRTLRRFRSLTRREASVPLERRLALQRELLAALRPRQDDLLALYDASVADADANFGALLAEFEKRGLLDRSLVVVLSDHGEEMLEHDSLLHGQSLYGELVRVPMLWRLPGGAGGGRRIETPVTLVDLVPTLLELLEHEEAGDAVFQGRSFAHLLTGEAGDAAEPQVTSVRVEKEFDYATPAPRGDLNIAVIHENWKGIWNVEPDRFELYALDRDPGEREDLATAEPDRARELRAAVERWFLERPTVPGGPAPATPIDPGDLERLRVLGYVE